MQNSKTLYQFLQSTQGSWRNAFYVDCIECPYGRTDCGGHLLTADAELRFFCRSCSLKR